MCPSLIVEIVFISALFLSGPEDKDKDKRTLSFYKLFLPSLGYLWTFQLKCVPEDM